MRLNNLAGMLSLGVDCATVTIFHGISCSRMLNCNRIDSIKPRARDLIVYIYSREIHSSSRSGFNAV